MPIEGHVLIKAPMVVISDSPPIARFTKGTLTDEEFELLTRASPDFENRKFSGFSVGSNVVATFRISPAGRRFLLHVRSPDVKREGEEKGTTSAIKIDEGFYYPIDARRIFTLADTIAKSKGQITILIVGPSGYGKTTLPQKFAEKTGRAHVRVNCAAIRDPEEWFGFREARDGSTVFEPTKFAEAIQRGSAVIVLDEINRLEPWLHNTLFPLLDDDRKTVIHNTEFKVADDTIFVMTLNYGMEFTGTFELDQAFLNRVHATLHVGPMSKQAEILVLSQRESITANQARKIVEIASKLRQLVRGGEITADCSTRATLRIAQLVKFGATIRGAFHDVIEATLFDDEARKKVSDVINSIDTVFDSEEELEHLKISLAQDVMNGKEDEQND